MSAAEADAGQDPPADLSDEERSDVERRKSPPARVVHEIVRQEGVDELERPTASLVWSGVAAGVIIWLSVISQAALAITLPDTPWRPAITGLGYSVGFIVVILGRLQLFTESTIVAVLPLASDLTLKNLRRTLRLWALVFGANMIGALALALILPRVDLVSPELLRAMVAVAHHGVDIDPAEAFTRGIPAGFLLATIAWLLPSARGQEIWVITLLTYIIAIAGFSHVVAGSAEAWLLAATGEIGWGTALFGFIMPVLAGNIIGGSGLFAVLAHAQVRSEL